MGKDLYENFASARHVFDEANEVLGFNLKELIFDGMQVFLLFF
jgi:[acyl-carrier-protein] S-malonyltransferase